MEYEYVETLVADARFGKCIAKEKLISEFTPFIKNMANKTIIPGYDYTDKENECIATLLICISKYNLGANRFATYAMNSIQKNLSSLIKRNRHATEFNGSSILSLDDGLENLISSDIKPLDEKICLTDEYNDLNSAINTKLTNEEKSLVAFLYFNKNTLSNYACHKNISYVTASKRKKKALGKLKNFMNMEEINYGY